MSWKCEHVGVACNFERVQCLQSMNQIQLTQFNDQNESMSIINIFYVQLDTVEPQIACCKAFVAYNRYTRL